MFKLCILEAGYINPALKDKYPPYSDVFKDFLKYKIRKWNVSSYKLYKNEFPYRIIFSVVSRLKAKPLLFIFSNKFENILLLKRMIHVVGASGYAC